MGIDKLTKWEVDQMGIDEVGTDKVGITHANVYLDFIQSTQLLQLGSIWVHNPPFFSGVLVEVTLKYRYIHNSVTILIECGPYAKHCQNP